MTYYGLKCRLVLAEKCFLAIHVRSLDLIYEPCHVALKTLCTKDLVVLKILDIFKKVNKYFYWRLPIFKFCLFKAEPKTAHFFHFVIAKYASMAESSKKKFILLVLIPIRCNELT